MFRFFLFETFRSSKATTGSCFVLNNNIDKLALVNAFISSRSEILSQCVLFSLSLETFF